MNMTHNKPFQIPAHRSRAGRIKGCRTMRSMRVGRARPAIFRYLWNGYWQGNMKEKEARVHPTQKPQPLMTWCMQRVPEAKTILDPWMGSGTTLVAAKALGLRAIGIEANETYCRAAVDRLAQDVLGLENDGAQRQPAENQKP